MKGAHVVRSEQAGSAPRQLFDRIGDFLTAQRLDPDPANYAFAYAILAYPDAPLAQAVARLTDGGVRLTLRDIEALGGEVTPGTGSERDRADGLIAQTQLQVEGFADIIQGLHAETHGFGRELAESADRIRQQQAALDNGSAAVAEVARITAAMVARVRTAEARLESATREAAELRAKLEEARDNARRDPLTDLPNRRAFEEAFASHAATDATMWLAVCDIDHFKSVNDRFGHAVGDRVLRAIAAALREACGNHLVARYGGEEFVVLFTDMDAGSARATLEIARELVATKRYRLRETDEPLGAVTFSAGLAPVAKGDTARAAFGRADRLLYRAKNEGRNCIRVG
ncbi:diguanylate cyclase [Sphingomonas cannabina]|uniref:GGDEF domain-containing protein n=1 Tax=Sphingomonas cannabina TaxID=2899123 RepID=UPI001F1A52BB|nr:GGDEF domain-containing protein [Sphingomonas cannabina]UIJ45507.1 diguanylate cyclase [Sphingomonas cannabina]